MEDNKEILQVNSHENLLLILVLDLARVVLKLKSAVRKITYSDHDPNWKDELRTTIDEADSMFDDFLKSIDAVRVKK